MPKAAPVVELTKQHVTSIQLWSEAKSVLDANKANELANRLTVINDLPFDDDKDEGSQTLKLYAGWKLLLKRTFNYSVDKDTQKVMACLNELGAINPGAASELIRWEPVLSEGAYKKLTENEKLIVAPIITMKPGTPSLELKPPAPPKDAA